MSSNYCQCKFNCVTTAVIASVIVGIIAAFLTFSGILAVGTPLLWVLFGIAVAYLAVTLISVQTCQTTEERRCLCPALGALLAGILGTVLFSLILLLIDIAIASVVGAVISGLLFLSFALTLTATAALIKCKTNCCD